ncbi:MAG: hypothetical protein AMJ53_09705 [Gammaproteobacteria bacterium SG8_11]|nr:MAG: hypothetical protein AMJ53_09705 [Gammaproteobacteria bacterium SG8_11]
MDNEAVRRVHWSFWLISVVALLWNVGGAINYFMQTNLEFVATLPETHRAIIEGRPAWATGGFAIGVFGGAIGCLLLLFRKSTSFYVFVASLLGIIVTMIHTTDVASSKINFSAAEIFVMILLPIIVAAILIWYTKLAIRKSWIE